MKHIIDKTNLADSLQKTSFALIMLEISVWLTPFTKQTAANPLFEISKTMRYIQQGTYAVTAILAFIAALSLKRLIPKTARRAIFDKLLFAMRKMASGLAVISKKMFSFFGIKSDRVKRGKDEKSFIFGEENEDEKNRKRHSVKAISKWRDMQENSEKIRFLYIKYILKIIKEGYRHHAHLTPNEVRKNIGLENEQEENEIFDLYNGARYSGGSVFITDEQVTHVMEIVNSKKKTKAK